MMPLTCTKANFQKASAKAATERQGRDCSRFAGFSTIMRHQEKLVGMRKRVFLWHSLSRIGLRGLLFSGAEHEAKLAGVRKAGKPAFLP